MTNRCTRCYRPLKNPSPTGMGRICSKAVNAEPVPPHERDLFGYDLDRAFHAARYRVRVHIEVMAAEARMAVTRDFAAARVRLLGWKARR
jgi:hypothetical protein